MNKHFTVSFGQDVKIVRNLPLCKVNDELYIAAFNMLGDTQVIKATALELFERAHSMDFDVILTSECKGIALAQEFARLYNEERGAMDYVVARKTEKIYMRNVLKTTVNSITTKNTQTLYLSCEECDKLRGKKVIIVDDVISTGNSCDALHALLSELNAECTAELCVFAEGNAKNRQNIIFLKELPLFDGCGEIIT